MELTVDEDDNCYYRVNEKQFYVGQVFQSSHQWYANSYNDTTENDVFSDSPFRAKQDAIRHIDNTMKAIFKKILADDI